MKKTALTVLSLLLVLVTLFAVSCGESKVPAGQPNVKETKPGETEAGNPEPEETEPEKPEPEETEEKIINTPTGGILAQANYNKDLQACRNAFTVYIANLDADELGSSYEKVLIYVGERGYNFIIKDTSIGDDSYASFDVAKKVAAEYLDSSKEWHWEEIVSEYPGLYIAVEGK